MNMKELIRECKQAVTKEFGRNLNENFWENKLLCKEAKRKSELWEYADEERLGIRN